MVLPWKVTKAANDSSVPQTEATGLARLKEVMLDQRAMEEEFRLKPPRQEDASTNPANHKDQVRYASGLWISRQPAKHSRHPSHQQNQLSSVSRLLRRSKRNSPEYSPWKRRKVHHESSNSVKKSELHHHSTTAHWPPVPAQAQQASSSSQSMASEADPMMATLAAAGRDMAVNMMKKRKPGLAGRMYDVPQIECPRSEDRMERFACPSPDFRGRYRCIDDRSLCDGFFDCPAREDENPDMCLFYKTTKAHLDILAEALLRWARGR